MDIMTTAERDVADLEKQNKPNESERLRHDVVNLLSKWIPRKIPSDMSRTQNRAMKELRSNDGCHADLSFRQRSRVCRSTS